MIRLVDRGEERGPGDHEHGEPALECRVLPPSYAINLPQRGYLISKEADSNRKNSRGHLPLAERAEQTTSGSTAAIRRPFQCQLDDDLSRLPILTLHRISSGGQEKGKREDLESNC